jgi:hypothetical protein
MRIYFDYRNIFSTPKAVDKKKKMYAARISALYYNRAQIVNS